MPAMVDSSGQRKQAGKWCKRRIRENERPDSKDYASHAGKGQYSWFHLSHASCPPVIVEAESDLLRKPQVKVTLFIRELLFRWHTHRMSTRIIGAMPPHRRGQFPGLLLVYCRRQLFGTSRQ